MVSAELRRILISITFWYFWYCVCKCLLDESRWDFSVVTVNSHLMRMGHREIRQSKNLLFIIRLFSSPLVRDRLSCTVLWGGRKEWSQKAEETMQLLCQRNASCTSPGWCPREENQPCPGKQLQSHYAIWTPEISLFLKKKKSLVFDIHLISKFCLFAPIFMCHISLKIIIITYYSFIQPLQPHRKSARSVSKHWAGILGGYEWDSTWEAVLLSSSIALFSSPLQS